MKTVTIDDVLSFHPCWKNARGRMEKITERYSRQEWTALDILRLPETLVSNVDKFWLVLREELIDAPILHEFACRCAERALTMIDNPYPRSLAAIAAKRAWLKGEITDEQLNKAQKAADTAVWNSPKVAAYFAVDREARVAASYAADYVARTARTTCGNNTERTCQVEMLIKMLDSKE